MIDPQLLRENPERVRTSQRARGEDATLVDALLHADERRRAAVTLFDTTRAGQKELGKRISGADAASRPGLLEQAKGFSSAVKDADAARSSAEAEWNRLALELSNVVEDGVPPGGEDDYVVRETVGEPTEFDFVPLDHVALGERLGALDMARGAKVSGARFYFLTGVGARLQLAMLNLAMSKAISNGFTPVVPPVLVKPAVMAGTGFLGQAAENVYQVAGEDSYLVGTAEVPLAGYHMNEILDIEALPLRYAGWSSCFRREAGSYGKDTAGIIRVHQFDKIEMFSYCRTQDAAAEHLRLLGWEREMLDAMEIPYRVIDVAAGDLGASAARKYDCEAWVPTQGRYRELTSTSNCTQFQARRLNVRARSGEGKPEFVATLNGTLATTRWLVAILENHQRRDGSVTVPTALRPWLDGAATLEPV